MQNCKIFGDSSTLEFIPKPLLNPFSVVGVQSHLQEAIHHTHALLKQHRRVQSLILVFSSDLTLPNSYQNMLKDIANYGCKLYFFIPKDAFRQCNQLSQLGLVIAL